MSTLLLLLLSQPSNLCSRKPVLVRSSPLLSDGLSSSSLPQNPPPRVIVCNDPCRPNFGQIIHMKNSRSFTPLEWKVAVTLVKEMGAIGSSNGWQAILKDGVMHLRDTDLNPVSWDTEPKRISLPPLITLPHCQTQVVTNVAMSSSSPEDEDCVVAVKYLGPQLSFCRPAAQRNSQRINIRIENPCFFSSPVMFSKKYDMFLIPGSGGHIIASWDHHNQSKNPKLQSLRFQNLPKLSKTKRDILDLCCMSEHLVESITTGETFMVKLYRKTPKMRRCGFSRMMTEALMVFKLDDEGNAVYTRDIGDLCIFLTKSESFCLPSSFSLSMCRPNCVKIIDVDENRFFKLSAQKWNRPRPLDWFSYNNVWFF